MGGPTRAAHARGGGTRDRRLNVRRPGWWFWGPFLFGLCFAAGGVVFLVGATRAGRRFGRAEPHRRDLARHRRGRSRRRGLCPSRHPIARRGAARGRDGRSPRRSAGSGRPGCRAGPRSARSSTWAATSTARRSSSSGCRWSSGAPPHDTVDRLFVPVPVARRLAVGATVPVSVAPGDPDRFAVDWSGLGATS